MVIVALRLLWQTFMIKILSSWTNMGGSTVAFLRLCKLFNEKGHECEFYGGHDWHISRADGKGKKMGDFNPSESDILITHYMLLGDDVPRKRHVLSLHETNQYDLKELGSMNKSVDMWDAIHYVSNSQRAYHAVNKTYQIIPNIVEVIGDYFPRSKLLHPVAGVIGSVDAHKQTHLSIERALKEGYDKIKIFGPINDIPYAMEHNDLIYHKKVEIMGYVEDQAAMYGQITKVFHSSKRETFNFIKAECDQIGMLYDGLESAESGAEVWDKDRIFEAWILLLEL